MMTTTKSIIASTRRTRPEERWWNHNFIAEEPDGNVVDEFVKERTVFVVQSTKDMDEIGYTLFTAGQVLDEVEEIHSTVKENTGNDYTKPYSIAWNDNERTVSDDPTEEEVQASPKKHFLHHLHINIHVNEDPSRRMAFYGKNAQEIFHPSVIEINFGGKDVDEDIDIDRLFTFLAGECTERPGLIEGIII